MGQYEVLSFGSRGNGRGLSRARHQTRPGGRDQVLPEEVATDVERLARFEREARVLASLNHDNIATLYGFENDGDTKFLIMEVVEGETLADRCRARGSIPIRQALPLFLQIADGLQAAHEKGILTA